MALCWSHYYIALVENVILTIMGFICTLSINGMIKVCKHFEDMFHLFKRPYAKGGIGEPPKTDPTVSYFLLYNIMWKRSEKKSQYDTFMT